ncbi:MAG: hypothetical protein COA84_14085 [Robiginitomaculum sp.]|nr:MAG: hypothetical protein COA84_14085 [Robiginitomaculum sp.]
MFDYITLSTASDLDYLVSLEEARHHLRIQDDYDNDYIQTLIVVAKDVAEKYLNRHILESEILIQTDRVDMKLPQGAANSISEVTYENQRDDDGSRFVLDPTLYNFNNVTGSLNLTKDGRDAIRNEYPFRWQVTFMTGWADDEVPTPIKQAILLLIGTMYESREDSVVGQGVTVSNLSMSHKYLLDKYKLRRFG